MAAQFGQLETEPIVGDIATTFVEKGSAPVAVGIALRFSDQATPADLAGFAKGVDRGAGGRASPDTVGGKDVTFIKGPAPGFLYMGDDFALLFFGAGGGRSDLVPVVEAVVSAAD